MKKLTFIIAFLLSQVFLIAQTEDSCLPNGITFTTQEQIDNFQTNYPGCTEVEGDVAIDGDITSLAGLIVLTSIGGNLRIGADPDQYSYGHTLLEDLSGLDNLTTIGGDFHLGGNYSLTKLTGLENLNFIGGNIYIGFFKQSFTWNYFHGNPFLTSLTGLDNLSYIGGDFYIMLNDSLTELMTLSNLNSLEGSLHIGIVYTTDDWENITDEKTYYTLGNPSLTSLNGLESLISIGGSLELAGNNSLSNLAGLENLTSIGGELLLIDNASLTSLTELNNLISIGGNLSIGYLEWTNYFQGNVLKNLSGLENLTSIGGNLQIDKNDSLVNLTGLENLTSIGGDLIIGGSSIWDGNPSLTNLAGLNNLASIGDSLSIENNDALADLSGLESLESIGGYLYILDNATLSSLVGLDNIEAGSITDLYIENNNSLSTCEVQSVCDYLAAPNGTIEIHDNAPGCNSPEEVEEACESQCLYDGIIFTSQEQIDNFHSNYPDCTEIEGDVEISGTDITNLNALVVLTAIGGHLNIHDNPTLINLSGLENIESGSIDSLSITNNTILSACHAHTICNYLTGPNAISEIHDNAPGCNSPEEIIELCFVSLDEINAEPGFNIYPSPVGDFATLSFEGEGPGTANVILYNSTGIKVKTWKFKITGNSQNDFVLDFSALPEGMYFVKVQLGNEMATKKIMKVK